MLIIYFSRQQIHYYMYQVNTETLFGEFANDGLQRWILDSKGLRQDEKSDSHSRYACFYSQSDYLLPPIQVHLCQRPSNGPCL